MASQPRVQPIESPPPDRTEAFAERMVGVVNEGCLALMISVGHRTGLFETMAGREASTSAEIAEARALWPRVRLLAVRGYEAECDALARHLRDDLEWPAAPACWASWARRRPSPATSTPATSAPRTR